MGNGKIGRVKGANGHRRNPTLFHFLCCGFASSYSIMYSPSPLLHTKKTPIAFTFLPEGNCLNRSLFFACQVKTPSSSSYFPVSPSITNLLPFPPCPFDANFWRKIRGRLEEKGDLFGISLSFSPFPSVSFSYIFSSLPHSLLILFRVLLPCSLGFVFDAVSRGASSASGKTAAARR